MSQVQVIALKEGSPDGNRRYRKGARYYISDRSAQLLVKLGWVRLAPEHKDAGRKDVRA